MFTLHNTYLDNITLNLYMLTLDENLDDIVRVKDDDAVIGQPLNESR